MVCGEEPSNSKPGYSIGTVSIRGDLIGLELNDRALGNVNLFNLAGHTLHFTPAGSQYRVTTAPLLWDSNYGPELSRAGVDLESFAFPFSGKEWQSFLVGASGSIRFGVDEKDIGPDPYGLRDGGVVLGRFDELTGMAAQLGGQVPAICVFLKPRLSGSRYVKELSDRVVITWDLTEPFGGVLDFGWYRTVNRFQAVLHRDGSIDMSYKEVAARDAIVGIYPTLSGTAKAAAVHFSALSRSDGPFSAVYEAFHYLAVPRPEDLSCTIIKALGDRFDFLVYYSDFRIDNQEASTPGDGPVVDNVTGIGPARQNQSPEAMEQHCTQGRFQIGFAQPVYIGSNEAQEAPPADAPRTGNHNITFFARQLSRLPYNYAVGHLGHEVGHRWSAYVTAKIGGKLVPLTDWPHWVPGLQSEVAFPYSLPIEASTLGGGVWQDNNDGTYTQLRDGFFVPATGYSYLDLYLMGLASAAEVPDFFLLQNLVPRGVDARGHHIYSGERINVSIQDVIAAEGPRSPDTPHSQKQFNTAIVVITEHGKRPSRELIERATGIRRQWIQFWKVTTGERGSMTANPR